MKPLSWLGLPVKLVVIFMFVQIGISIFDAGVHYQKFKFEGETPFVFFTSSRSYEFNQFNGVPSEVKDEIGSYSHIVGRIRIIVLLVFLHNILLYFYEPKEHWFTGAKQWAESKSK